MRCFIAENAPLAVVKEIVGGAASRYGLVRYRWRWKGFRARKSVSSGSRFATNQDVTRLVLGAGAVACRAACVLRRKFSHSGLFAAVGRICDSCQNNRKNKKEEQENECNHGGPNPAAILARCLALSTMQILWVK